MGLTFYFRPSELTGNAVSEQVRTYVHGIDQECIQNCRLAAGGRYRISGGCSGRRADAACVLTIWQHFSAWIDTLKVWRQIENPTPSIDAWALFTWRIIYQIPDPIWNDGTLGFLRASPQQQQFLIQNTSICYVEESSRSPYTTTEARIHNYTIIHTNLISYIHSLQPYTSYSHNFLNASLWLCYIWILECSTWIEGCPF